MQQTRLITGIFSDQGTLLCVLDCVGFQTFSKYLKGYNVSNVWCTVTSKQYVLLDLLI